VNGCAQAATKPSAAYFSRSASYTPSTQLCSPPDEAGVFDRSRYQNY
jgi:hypothetical protein